MDTEPDFDNPRAFTAAEVTDLFGDRCGEFDPDCVVCRMWARHDIVRTMACEDERTRYELANA